MNGVRRTDSHQRRPSRPPRGPRGLRGPANSAPPRQRRAASGRHGQAEPPEVVWEICILDGQEGQRLARQQARVLWEVTEWLARNKSKRGPGHVG